MGDTDIGWTHRPGTRGRSWNPTQGCALKSEGCRNCYAMRMAARFAKDGWSKGLINLRTGKWNGEARLAEHKLDEPLRWRDPSTVFVNSMSDLFYEGFTNEQIATVFGVMAACPRHTFQCLTKRPKRMREWFAWCDGPLHCIQHAIMTITDPTVRDTLVRFGASNRFTWPLPQVWLGVSVENQDAADERIPELLATPAAVRFLSCEPLLGPLDLLQAAFNGADSFLSMAGIGLVIDGCESGPSARPADDRWYYDIAAQCRTAGVPYFHKQMMVDGRLVHDLADFPVGLRSQEFPR